MSQIYGAINIFKYSISVQDLWFFLLIYFHSILNDIFRKIA